MQVSALFLRELLEGIPLQKKGERQEERKHGTQEKGGDKTAKWQKASLG